MALSESLLNLLVCPETKQPVVLADEKVLGRINDLIAAGSLCDASGRVLGERLSGVLVRSDGQIAYAVIDDIPIMLVEEAIPLSQLGS